MQGRSRVLAIEDDPDLGVLYESFLGAEGHEVRVAQDAREGLRMMRDPPDVVLLDLMLPGMDGYELMREMRRRPDLKDIPVIVVSASVPPGRHRIPGADAVVHKPFEFDGLLRTIDGLSHHQAA
ncbi:MAG: response regulator [Candidatus Limnocylindria bacterium]